MSRKSRRERARHAARSQKRRETPSTQPAVAAKSTVPAASTPAAPAPPPNVPTPKVARTGARYSYITTELQRIGVLAGILVAILVILALVLP